MCIGGEFCWPQPKQYLLCNAPIIWYYIEEYIICKHLGLWQYSTNWTSNILRGISVYLQHCKLYRKQYSNVFFLRMWMGGDSRHLSVNYLFNWLLPNSQISLTVGTLWILIYVWKKLRQALNRGESRKLRKGGGPPSSSQRSKIACFNLFGK